MKKNEMSFDSFIIVESEDKKQQKKTKSQNINKSNKKIRDKFVEDNKNFNDDDEINTNKEINKKKENSEKKDDFNSILNNFELFDKKEDDLDYEEINNDDNINNNDKKEINTKDNLKNDGFINITPLSKEKPKNFESDIILLNYKKNITYKCKIKVEENFEVKIDLNKNNLYFNQ